MPCPTWQVERLRTVRSCASQPAGIWSVQLYLPFDGDIPLRYAIDEPPIFRFRIAKTGWHQHMVVVVKAVTPSDRVASKYGDGRKWAEGFMPNIVKTVS